MTSDVAEGNLVCINAQKTLRARFWTSRMTAGIKDMITAQFLAQNLEFLMS